MAKRAISLLLGISAFLFAGVAYGGDSVVLQHNESTKLSFPVASFADLEGYLKSIDVSKIKPEDLKNFHDLKKKVTRYAIASKIELGIGIGSWLPLVTTLVGIGVSMIWSKNFRWAGDLLKAGGTLGLLGTFGAIVSGMTRWIALPSLSSVVNEVNNMDLYDMHGLRKNVVLTFSGSSLVTGMVAGAAVSSMARR